MAKPSEEIMPPGLLDEFYERFYGMGGNADEIFLQQGSPGELELSRKTDIMDTFSKFSGVVGELLFQIGVEDPSAIDTITAYVSFQERQGFESGVKFVHDNAHVTSKAEARQQQSALYSMKTVGV